jgi:simple sugar transport system permease protein
MRKVLGRPELGAVAGAIVIFLLFTIVAGDKGFLTPIGFRTWLEVSAQLGIIGIGATMLMIGGEFDLSVGSMIAAAGMIFLLPVVQYSWPVWLAFIVAIGFALLVGYINGTLVNRTGLPSFIVTLAFLFILRGATLGFTREVTGATQVSVRSFIGVVEGVTTNAQAKDVIQNTFLGRMFSFPDLFGILSPSVIWWLILAIVSTWVLTRTQFGNWIFAVGGNAEAARNSGVPVHTVRITLFMWTAVLLTGGYGSTAGAVFGALIFGMTSQGIFIARWNTDWFRVFLGGLLLVAVLFNNFIRKRATEAK